jgi:hypothetical protein
MTVFISEVKPREKVMLPVARSCRVTHQQAQTFSIRFQFRQQYIAEAKSLFAVDCPSNVYADGTISLAQSQIGNIGANGGEIYHGLAAERV